MVKEKLDEWTIPKIRSGLLKYHNIDPISFEIAQPDRLDEILAEMVRRGIVKTRSVSGENTWKYSGE
jgi:hypothetical protein